MATAPRAALALAAALAASGAAALEPRFDHRDTHGPLVELLEAHDTLARPSATTVSSWRPSLRAGWGFDPFGAGDELLVSAAVALRSFEDPGGERVLLELDARYRGYFGTEEWKTFFEIGAWAPLRSRLAGGPLVGLGVAYDLSRYTGVWLSGTFATAFGEARVASFTAGLGAQLRFDLP